jgi:DNA-directed RNA polymerase
MVCKPKPYAPNILGGYMLNDENEINKLFIKKALYRHESYINYENIIYDTINLMMNCPFKINKNVLDFIMLHNSTFKFLTDEYHKYEDIDKSKRGSYRENILKAHKSKVFLEGTILDIANLYRDCSQFYIPLRLDQRGRIYCESHYLNYQGSDLAKALLLFANPGYINRDDEYAIRYFYAYGANCFGYSKQSLEYRVE